MIDEFAHAGSEHLDPGFVAGFDRKQGYPDPAGDLASSREHGVGRASTVVDLGAGTGRFALAAAAEVSRVVAVDVSPAMQATLRERVDRAGLSTSNACRLVFLDL
jgi:SAM-dependent methyltransferase